MELSSPFSVLLGQTEAAKCEVCPVITDDRRVLDYTTFREL
jgi:hypothetical protein